MVRAIPVWYGLVVSGPILSGPLRFSLVRSTQKNNRDLRYAGMPVCLPVCRYAGMPVCLPVCLCAGMPVCQYSMPVLPVCWYAGVLYGGMPVCRFAGLPVCQYAGMPVCRYAGMPAGMQVCRYAGVPVCRYAGMPVCRRAGAGPNLQILQFFVEAQILQNILQIDMLKK